MSDATVADEVGADEPDGPVTETLHGAPLTRSRGQTVLHPDRTAYRALVETLRAEGYWVCVDVCAVDHLGNAARGDLPAGVAVERFELVVNLINHRERSRIRIRVQVPEDDPVVATICDLHPGVENHERETWDLFGIHFEGHPDPTRILLPDDWEGHPLRKDDPAGRIPVQFKGDR